MLTKRESFGSRSRVAPKQLRGTKCNVNQSQAILGLIGFTFHFPSLLNCRKTNDLGSEGDAVTCMACLMALDVYESQASSQLGGCHGLDGAVKTSLKGSGVGLVKVSYGALTALLFPIHLDRGFALQEDSSCIPGTPAVPFPWTDPHHAWFRCMGV